MRGSPAPVTPGERAGGAEEPAVQPWRWLHRNRTAVDVLVACVIFTYNALVIGPVPLLNDGATSLALAAVSVLLCGAYPLRHRYPLQVFGLVFTASCVPVALSAHPSILFADLVLGLMVYHLASRFRWPVSVPAAVLVAVWVPFAALPMLRLGHADIGGVGLLVLAVVWAWTWGLLVRVRREHTASLREHAARLVREQEARAQVVAAEERARIAREIHDIVSHSLGVMVVVADGAAAKARTEPARAEQAMVRVRETGRTAMSEMRRMLDILREGPSGELAPQPGTARLERLVEDSRETGLPVEFTVSGRPRPLPPGLDLAVYRIVQEALTNVRKHAGPGLTRAEVALAHLDHGVRVRVADDGAGPGVGGASGDGHGLVGMRERTAAYRGTLSADVRPSGGFEVVAEFPIGDEER